MKIGAHVSTAGGPVTAFERAEAIGAEAAQIFLTPPQQWRSSKVDDEGAAAFRARASGSTCGPVFVHGVYLINLATSDTTNLTRSTSSLKSAMTSCSQLGIQGVIFHLGSHKGMGLDAVFDQICVACKEVIDNTPGDTQLILENSAGSGGTIGSRFEDLGRIIKMVGSDRLKVCVDTQHSFAAGYDLSSAEGLELAMTEFEQEVGFDNLVAVHANDSKVELGSGRDRHENIGEGLIGRDGFRRIIAHRALQGRAVPARGPRHGRQGPGRSER